MKEWVVVLAHEEAHVARLQREEARAKATAAGKGTISYDPARFTVEADKLTVESGALIFWVGVKSAKCGARDRIGIAP